MAENKAEYGDVKRITEVFGIVVLHDKHGNRKSFVTTAFRGAHYTVDNYVRENFGQTHVKLKDDNFYVAQSVDEVNAMVMEAHQNSTIVTAPQ